jgi:hypothetical protein
MHDWKHLSDDCKAECAVRAREGNKQAKSMGQKDKVQGSSGVVEPFAAGNSNGPNGSLLAHFEQPVQSAQQVVPAGEDEDEGTCGPWSLSDNKYPLAEKTLQSASLQKAFVSTESKKWCSQYGKAVVGSCNPPPSLGPLLKFCQKLGGCYYKLKAQEQQHILKWLDFCKNCCRAFRIHEKTRRPLLLLKDDTTTRPCPSSSSSSSSEAPPGPRQTLSAYVLCEPDMRVLTACFWKCDIRIDGNRIHATLAYDLQPNRRKYPKLATSHQLAYQLRAANPCDKLAKLHWDYKVESLCTVSVEVESGWQDVGSADFLPKKLVPISGSGPTTNSVAEALQLVAMLQGKKPPRMPAAAASKNSAPEPKLKKARTATNSGSTDSAPARALQRAFQQEGEDSDKCRTSGSSRIKIDIDSNAGDAQPDARDDADTSTAIACFQPPRSELVDNDEEQETEDDDGRMIYRDWFAVLEAQDPVLEAQDPAAQEDGLTYEDQSGIVRDTLTDKPIGTSVLAVLYFRLVFQIWARLVPLIVY